MIHVIVGEKGAGKTKRIIDMANEATNSSHGSLIYIDDDSKYMFDLKHQIRFIDASEYAIDGPKMFFGFVSGIAAQDFDLENLYIDGFLKIVHHDLDTLEGLFEDLAVFAQKRNVNVFISINGDPNTVPEFLKKYIQYREG